MSIYERLSPNPLYNEQIFLVSIFFTLDLGQFRNVMSENFRRINFFLGKITNLGLSWSWLVETYIMLVLIFFFLLQCDQDYTEICGSMTFTLFIILLNLNWGRNPNIGSFVSILSVHSEQSMLSLCSVLPFCKSLWEGNDRIIWFVSRNFIFVYLFYIIVLIRFKKGVNRKRNMVLYLY